MAKIKTTAIIGAGPGGLVAAKECIEAGLHPVIFEAAPDLGGVWRTKTWNGMHSLLSRFHMGFSDTPFIGDTDFPAATEVLRYLHEYAAHHKLGDMIRTQTPVRSIDFSRERWRINTHDYKNGTSEYFDSLILASGVFGNDYIPEIKGMDQFNGTLLHGSAYKNAEDFQGKKTVVIGGSYSGYEIASDLATHGVEVHHTFREPAWVAGLYTNNVPFDLVSYRYAPAMDEAIKQENWLKKLAYLQTTYGNPGDAHAALVMDALDPSPAKIVLAPDYLQQVRNQHITPHRAAPVEFSARGVHISSGDHIDADAVIFCTGYTGTMPRFPFMEIALKHKPDDMFQPLVMNKATIHPQFPSMAMVGMFRGPYFGTMEMQARWAAALFSEQVKHPTALQHKAALGFEQNLRDLHARPSFPRPDYVGFMLELAQEIGAVPNDLLHSNQPMLPSDFRLSGIGAKPVLGYEGRASLQQRLDQP